MRTGFRFISLAIILIIAAFGLFPGGTALATGETIVTVSAPAEVQQGEQFTVSITVEPGTAIASMQFNLAYDTSLLDADEVSEGNLLSQGGATTYFNPGTIDDAAGTVTGVVGAITEPGASVSTPGTFATITMTAGTQAGTSTLTLSNVIAGDINDQPVTVIATGGQVNIGQASGGEEDSGGGNNGGGISGTTSLRNSISMSGALMEDVSATDINAKIKIRIARGTIVLNRNGQPPTSIRITPKVKNSRGNPGTQVVSQSYEIEPSGTTFNPGATLIYKYSKSEIPQGVSPDNLFLALWDEEKGQWIELGGVVDTSARTVSVPIQHLSTYALLVDNRAADFQFGNLTSSSPDIAPGGSTEFSVVVTNTGDKAGDCDVVLKLDGTAVETLTVHLGSGESQTATFIVTRLTAGEHIASVGNLSLRFSVREVLTPANFVTSNLNIYPPDISLGDSISISMLVTNIGDLPGTYHAVLRVANTEKASTDIELAGGESKNVSFSIIPEDVGNYTVVLGDLQSAFSVMIPTTVEPVVTELKISDFQISPVYDPDTNKLVLMMINYQLEGTPGQIAGSRLVLKISHQGEYLEEVPVSLEESGEGNIGSYSYIPSTGWQAGEYRFQIALYQGDIFLQNSEQREYTATPEAIAPVFSWNIMAIVIASAIVVAIIVVILTVMRRHDMF